VKCSTIFAEKGEIWGQQQGMMKTLAIINTPLRRVLTTFEKFGVDRG
jgi:hypothetical protein